MGYCYPRKYKNNSTDIKVLKQPVQEIPEKAKKIKQDYNAIRNIVMEDNKVQVSIPETKKTNKLNII